MGDSTRTEYAITGFQRGAFCADFNDVFTFERIDQLVFFVVKVTTWASLFVIRLLQDEQGSTGVLR
jgi:hypothetical protein